MRKTHAVSVASVRSEPLPSLLLACEAAARHSSVTRAAAELGVTRTAINRQVRDLEKELEVALFRRSPQRVALTAEGQGWAAELQVVYARLRETHRRLRGSRNETRAVVAVSVMPSFGSRWLVPRLGRLLSQHAELEVRISASERLGDFGLELRAWPASARPTQLIWPRTVVRRRTCAACHGQRASTSRVRRVPESLRLGLARPGHAGWRVSVAYAVQQRRLAGIIGSQGTSS